MTDLLIRLFIRDPENTRSEAVRTAYGNLAGLVGDKLSPDYIVPAAFVYLRLCKWCAPGNYSKHTAGV